MNEKNIKGKENMSKTNEQNIEKLANRRATITLATLAFAEAVVFGISISIGGMNTGLGMLVTGLIAMCAGAISMQKAAEIFDKKHILVESEDDTDKE